MRARLRRVLAALAVAGLCAAAAGCGASHPAAGGTAGVVKPTGSRLQSILQEDDLLLYSTPGQQFRTLLRIKALGVDVVKVAFIWWLVAPAHSASVPPAFNAANPDAYPRGAWTRYDYLVEEAHFLGLRVYFQVDPPVPRWAIAPNYPLDQGEALGHAPSAALFRQFVEAAGRRYSGSWHDLRGRRIPRVSEWGVWNEPNWHNWLNPTSLNVDGVQQTAQPMLYRGLVNAAWNGLAASGHRGDTFLVGETANIGSVPPIRFAEDLYCVGPTYQPLTGVAAEALGCPASGDRSAFVAQNPGLFDLSGYAHHPYAFDIPPSHPLRVHTEVALYNISQLERTLNGIFAGYGRSRSGGIPIYLSEWGYVTNPPNPEYHTTLQEQAAWLNQGEYMMWRRPYVKALAQFLLVDVPSPPPNARTAAAWLHVFATGLAFNDGAPKPALAAYRIPIWLPAPHPGDRVPVWGQLRPAKHSGAQTGQIDFRPAGSGTWRRLRAVTTASSEGFVLTHVAIPSPGLVRLGWRSPSGTVFYSRSVLVS